MIIVTEAWKQTHQGAFLGLMSVKGIMNETRSDGLEQRKRALENSLRSTYTTKEDIGASAPIAAYSAYYKRYKKTYHVLQQLESIVCKHKQIPSVSSVVEAMFMAELKNGLLTAGHDCAKVRGTLSLDAAQGTESYMLINGKEQVVKPGDMVLADETGILSSIVYGPDLRTCIQPHTQEVLFVVYAPQGIDKNRINNHLADIYEYVKITSPAAWIASQEICG